MLKNAFHLEDPAKADLTACCIGYIKECGLTDDEIAALKENLSGTPEKPAEQPKPAAEEKTQTVYTVVRGDCLWALARRFYGSGTLYKRIAEANHIQNLDLILVGQKLVIPA